MKYFSHCCIKILTITFMKNIVCYICFNRPDKTLKSLASIVEYNPPKIYIFQDFPRAGNDNDIEKCESVKHLIQNMCFGLNYEHHINKKNFGSTRNNFLAVSTLFKKYQKVIFIEDDCLVNSETFKFFDFYLDYYKDEHLVLSLSGYNPLNTDHHADLISSHFMCWGWASWSRSFKDFSGEEAISANTTKKLWLFSNKNLVTFLIWRLTLFSGNITNSWDSACKIYMLRKFPDGVFLYPRSNLVENIGFDAEATRTSIGTSNKFRPYPSPVPPELLTTNRDFDKSINKTHFHIGIIRLIGLLIHKIAPKFQLQLKELYFHYFKY